MKQSILSARNSIRGLGFLLTVFVANSAMAQEAAASNEQDVKMFAYLAAGLAIGIAALGGTLGQGRAATAALEGIARNPDASGKIFTPMILALSLIESLVILAFVIAMILQGK